MIVLDTSAIIDFIKRDKKLAEAVKSAEDRGEPIAVASVSLFELLTPIHHKNMPQKEQVLRAFLHNLVVLPLDAEASEESARIMGSLLKIEKPTKVLDAMIAGTASSNGASALITKDEDFDQVQKISNLNIQIL
jgi:predicted nucleic acid-binding protein